MTAAERDRGWNGRRSEFHKALNRLYRRSQLAPITDEYGYNQRYEGTRNYPVRDLMLEFTINQWAIDGTIGGTAANGSEHIDFSIRLCHGKCGSPELTSQQIAS